MNLTNEQLLVLLKLIRFNDECAGVTSYCEVIGEEYDHDRDLELANMFKAFDQEIGTLTPTGV